MAREAVRVLLVDDANEVLLVRFQDGDRSWWCTPGGGLEDGESHEEAARREIREETGLAAIELGPIVWIRRHAGEFRGQRFDQKERIYLARVTRFAPRPSDDSEPEHASLDMRWWSLDELEASTEVFAPRKLPLLFRELLQDGPPAFARDVGV